MRISDWSSDVCSSDLPAPFVLADLEIPGIRCHPLDHQPILHQERIERRQLVEDLDDVAVVDIALVAAPALESGLERQRAVEIRIADEDRLAALEDVGFVEREIQLREIGRASCRERVCQYG